MRAYIDDGYRPHRFPLDTWDGEEVIAWKCRACGEIVRDGAPPAERSDCPVDWRNDPGVRSEGEQGTPDGE